MTDVCKAAEAMFEIVGKTNLPDEPEYCTRAHLQGMLMKIMLVDVTGDKAHRWLGYVQGIVAIQKGATLEQLKDLNR